MSPEEKSATAMSPAERDTSQPVSPAPKSAAADEETPLLASLEAGPVAAETANLGEQNAPETNVEDDSAKKTAMIGSIIVLYFGVWIASVDTTMVITVYNTISSDLGRFEDAMWILAAYQQGMAPTQPLYGKLSDIFGHKAMFTIAYILFATGSIISGLGSSLIHFAAGRVVAGAGGAGMRSLVSSLIVHLVPLREVAVWRSWMYVVATFGRSTGAPLGGILTDSIGWRGSFISQAPLTLLALALVWWKLPAEFEHSTVEREGIALEHDRQTKSSKFRRIDFPGAFLIATSIVSFVLVLNFASKKLTIYDPLILGLILLWVFSSFLFLLVEAKFASEPIFPLRLLLERDVLTAYLIMSLLIAGHMSVSVLLQNSHLREYSVSRQTKEPI